MRLVRSLVGSTFLLVATAALASAKPVPFIVEITSSMGLRPGDSVVSEGRTIGEVAEVSFGESHNVEIRIEIDEEHRTEIRESSTFVATEPLAGKRPVLEHYALDLAAPSAPAGARLAGTNSLADVWIARGRVSAEDLNQALEQGVHVLRRNLEQLKRSEQWAKLKEQIATLSARLTVTGAEIAALLNEELPKLQQELDSLYEESLREMERQRAAPTP